MPEEEKKQTETVAEQVNTQVEKPVVEAEEYDEKRAMETIKKQRASEADALKQLASVQKKLAAFEEAEKKRLDAELSETERLKKQLAEKDATLKTLMIDSWKREAAEKVGLPIALANRLKGETPEELEIDAKTLLETLPKTGQPKVGTTNPGSNATGVGETDDQKLARIHGRGVNIFDPVTISKLGGGVSFTTKTSTED